MTGPLFRVLGPVEVATGRPGTVLQPRHRAAVAALVVDAGRVVPHDVLVDRVRGQGGAQPVTVQALVSKLRRLLEPDRAPGAWRVLVTRPPGYRLEEPVELLLAPHDGRPGRGAAAPGERGGAGAGGRARVRAAVHAVAAREGAGRPG